MSGVAAHFNKSSYPPLSRLFSRAASLEISHAVDYFSDHVWFFCLQILSVIIWFSC